VISSSHSRSLGAVWAAGGGVIGIGAGCAGADDPPEHAATNSHAIHRTMHRC